MNPPLPREHGTQRGYMQHRNRGDLPACEPCLVAHAAATNASYHAKRQQVYAPEPFPRWIEQGMRRAMEAMEAMP